MKTVTNYLDSLIWDDTPRLDRWLINCAGAEDNSYVQAVSRLILGRWEIEYHEYHENYDVELEDSPGEM